MEQYFNRAEITGRVGSVRIFDTGSGKIAKFAVVTQKAFTNRDGVTTIRNDWHCIKAWNRTGFPDIESIECGALVHVIGEMQQAKYVTADGVENCYPEIIADKLEIVS